MREPCGCFGRQQSAEAFIVETALDLAQSVSDALVMDGRLWNLRAIVQEVEITAFVRLSTKHTHVNHKYHALK